MKIDIQKYMLLQLKSQYINEEYQNKNEVWRVCHDVEIYEKKLINDPFPTFKEWLIERDLLQEE